MFPSKTLSTQRMPPGELCVLVGNKQREKMFPAKTLRTKRMPVGELCVLVGSKLIILKNV